VTAQPDELLFTYGTLQYPEVQLDTFGRLLETEPDVLARYTVDYLEMTDPRVVELSGDAVHPVVRETGNPLDKVTGMVVRLTEAELAAADEYEIAHYRRATVTLESGRPAWLYLPRLSHESAGE
jgi:gamma-glutamylcyclotransferase (GGCT)/AIG2-like uncharacterized protein YtfP